MKKSIGAHTIAYPNPVWCVGSYDLDGKPNVMTIAWGGDLLFKTTGSDHFPSKGNIHIWLYNGA